MIRKLKIYKKSEINIIPTRFFFPLRLNQNDNVKTIFQVLLIFATTFLIISCDGGLAPPEVVSGFSGTIYYKANTWPPSDSLVNLWLFASKLYPLDSNTIFMNLGTQILLYPSILESLPFNVDSTNYTFIVPVDSYKYIGVIQQIKPELLVRNFRVVGVYKDKFDTTKIGQLQIEKGKIINQINIQVDFHNIPPQPF